jgi:hypothetical protein
LNGNFVGMMGIFYKKFDGNFDENLDVNFMGI